MTRKVGRLREAAAEILCNNGLPVDARDIILTEGVYRSRFWDVIKWQVNGLGCWQTLTEFCKNAKRGYRVMIGDGNRPVDGDHGDICCYPDSDDSGAKK